MKQLLLLLTSLVFISINKSTSPKETYYYFCFSRALKADNPNIKEVITYTEAKKIECESSILKSKSLEWGTRMNNNCKNAKGCTSDLDYYYNIETATSILNKKLKQYKDTSKFVLQKVDF